MHFVQVTIHGDKRLLNLEQIIDLRIFVGTASTEYILVTAMGPEQIDKKTYEQLAQEIAGVPYMEKYDDEAGSEA